MNRNQPWTSRRRRRDADLFFADLMGWAQPSPREEETASEGWASEHLAPARVALYLVETGRWGRGFVNRGIADEPDRIHAAQDVPGPRGTSVYAVLDGVVIFVGRRRGYGNQIILRHAPPDDVTTAYSHLDSVRVQPGQRVRAAEVIGTMGNTAEDEHGNRGGVRPNMGVHLHFSIQRVPLGWTDAQIAAAYSSRYEERRDIRIEPRVWLAQKNIALARVEYPAPPRRPARVEVVAEQVARSLVDYAPVPPAEDMEQQLPPARTTGCPLPRGSSCAYFFKGAGYVRYRINTDRVDVGPAPIAQFWTRLPAEFQSGLDASVNWGNGYAYFFKGSGYVRYNIATDRVDVGPAPIARFWTRLPAEFQSGINAAVNWGNGYAYFFKGAGYIRYNIATDLVDVGPAPIARFWTALPAEFQSNLDSVVDWGDGHAYFFKGAGYVRYRMADNRVDVGPAPISQFWTALPAEFQSGIKAAINWSHPVDLAALMRAAGLAVTETPDWRTRRSQGAGGCFTPIGVMMHHTVGTGPNALADIVRHVKANFFVDRAGALTVVSGGRSNHAGTGAQRVLDETAQGVVPSGTARARRLVDGPFGNGHYYGFENENRGDGVQPWPEVQLDTMARGAAALCQIHGWSTDRVISHAEWTAGKVDPLGVDMNAFRARVASHF